MTDDLRKPRIARGLRGTFGESLAGDDAAYLAQKLRKVADLAIARKTTPVNPQDAEILGVAELAALLNVKPVTVSAYLSRWKSKGETLPFPPPDYELAATPVWKQTTIRKWKEQR